MADEAVYLITHKDIPFDIHGANGGAEMAALALARYLALEGKRVFFAAQLTCEEEHVDGVEFWSLGKDYNITKALQRIRKIGPYHLISACRAHAILESRYDKLCLSRIFMSHDQHGNDAGIGLPVVSHVADSLVCVSQAHAAEFIKGGVDQSKLQVIHNGVDHSIFKDSPPESRDYFNLVFAGALVRDKGVDVLLQAFINLKPKYPKLSLDIYGSASLWNREPYINEQDIEKHVPDVKFHGKKPQRDISAAFQRAGICVVPSIWFEAFPLTAIEAQVTGCPVAAFAVGGLKEAIKHNQTGVLIENISVESLTQTLDALLSKPEQLRSFSKEALRTLRPYYNWQRVAKTVIQLTEKAASVRQIDSKTKALNNITISDTQAPSCSVLILSNSPNQDSNKSSFADVLSRTLIVQGIQAVHEHNAASNPGDYDLVHILYSPDEDWLRSEITNVMQANVPLVLSVAAGDRYINAPSINSIASYLIEYVHRNQDQDWLSSLSLPADRVENESMFSIDPLAQYAKGIIAYGASDISSLKFTPELAEKARSIALGIDPNKGSAAEFEKRYGLQNFVLCVAPLLPAYNQLMLLKALEDSELTLVIASSVTDSSQGYAAAARSFKRAGETLVIEQLSQEYRQHAFAASKVHVMASWLEPPQAPTLAAAHHSSNIVISRNNCLVNAFANNAFFCSPTNEGSIRTAIEAAYHSPNKPLPASAPPKWGDLVKATIEVYQQVLS
jgi:glycosyltransferase involved in cell wall biosynthesis